MSTNNLNLADDFLERLLEVLRGLSDEDLVELMDRAEVTGDVVFDEDSITVDLCDDKEIICPNCGSVFTLQD